MSARSASMLGCPTGWRTTWLGVNLIQLIKRDLLESGFQTNFHETCKIEEVHTRGSRECWSSKKLQEPEFFCLSGDDGECRHHGDHKILCLQHEAAKISSASEIPSPVQNPETQFSKDKMFELSPGAPEPCPTRVFLFC